MNASFQIPPVHHPSVIPAAGTIQHEKIAAFLNKQPRKQAGSCGCRQISSPKIAESTHRQTPVYISVFYQLVERKLC
jgi:hypothetical protein